MQGMHAELWWGNLNLSCSVRDGRGDGNITLREIG